MKSVNQNHWKVLALGLLLLMFVVGCSKVSKDETKPEILLFEIAEDRLEVGEPLEVEVNVGDNEELAQVRLRLAPAFSKSFGAWAFNQISNASGTSFAYTYSFAVPDSALAGYYAVSLQVVDKRGNASQDSLQYISIIRDDEAPALINFETKPSSDGQLLELNPGDTLSFSGMAYDVDSLSQVEILLQDAGANTLYSSSYALDDSTDVFDFGLYADSLFIESTETLPHQLLIKVTDAQGNLLREVVEVE